MDTCIGFDVLGKGPINIKFVAGETDPSKLCSDLRFVGNQLWFPDHEIQSFQAISDR